MTGADKTKLLGTVPVGRLFLRLAAPALLCQLVMMLNNVVDRMWVGHIAGDGMLSLGAVGMSLPIQTLFMSVLLMLATGMAPTLSIMLGKGQRTEGARVSGACFALATILNLAIFAVIEVFADQLLMAFGASAESLPYGRSYLRTIAWGMPFGNTLFLMTMWFNAQGYVIDGVRLNMTSVIINAVLDPVCIFLLGMGVSGAALATNVGAIVAFGFGLRKMLQDGRLVRFGFADFVPRIRLLLPTLALGVSTFLNVIFESVSLLLINAQLQKYGGDRAVAAMSLMGLSLLVVMSVSLGLSLGAQPIIGYNYGKGEIRRVVTVNRWLIGTSFAGSFALWLVAMVSPSLLWTWMTDDTELVAYTAGQTRLFFAVMLVSGIQYAHIYIVKYLRFVKMSLFFSVIKRGAFLVPSILVFPLIASGDKVKAVLLASPVSDGLAFLVTAACYFVVMRKLKGGGSL